MARKERPLDGDDATLLRFAADLRRLRHEAGSPPYRRLAARAHYSVATLSEAAAGRRLPSLDVTLSYVRACGGDTAQWERRWQEAAAELAAAPAAGGGAADGDPEPGTGAARQDGGPEGAVPYAGLSAFRAEDADRFFGRERLVEDLLAALARHRVVALVGASGAGKSSLLHAGLLPRLAADAQVHVLTPGPHPLDRLRRALGPGGEAGGPGPVPGPGAEPGAEPRSGSAYAQASGPGYRPGWEPGPEGRVGSGEVVVVLDQFEEVFTVCADAAERERFIAALVGPARRAGSRCRVVLGVRADFYAHCTRHAPLVPVLRDAQVVVGPMTAAELRRAVVEPARRAGLTVEGALQATLVAHAHGRVGALPLLSHALLETWRRRRGAALTLDGFRAAGGFEGALAQSAEALYASLTERQRLLAQQIFVHLIALGEGTEDTKRPVKREELNREADDDADTATVLARAARMRLLTLDHGRVELTHEALIRAWPRLRGWLTDDRERLRLHRRLTDAAHAWERLGRDPGALYRGPRLALARDLAATRATGLTAVERAFLDAGTEAEAAADSSARRRARRLGYLVALLGALVVVAGVATASAVRSGAEVTRQRNDAVAQNLADSIGELADTEPGLAVQLSLTAYRLSPTAKTRDSLVSTLMTAIPAHPKEVLALAYRPDGRQLATGSGDHTARLWRVNGTDRPVQEAVLGGHGDDVRTVAYRPDGRLLATGSADGTVRLWDVADPARPAALASLTGQGGDVRAVAFSPDGRTLATSGTDGSVGLWDATDTARPALLATLAGHHDAVRAVAFSPDGRTLASAGEDRTVRLTDVADPRRPGAPTVLEGHDTVVFSVAFSPDGTVLASAGGGRNPIRLWNTADPRRPALLATLTGHTDVVGSVAFSPDGRSLASASDDRTVRLWSVARPAHAGLLATLTGHATAVGSVAFSPDGAVLASGGFDTTVRLSGTDLARTIAGACAHTGARITRAQWSAHLPYVAYSPPCSGLERPSPSASGPDGRPGP
ncbi:XRE family transcriptional regulator [Streptomyces sp. NPDC046866]|uniref:nSTAND1 domain-containing NTPase n=1 Tax=Streptomyces sp. NPDC046866 TaxID=3154921 RepID=UPI0034564DEB